MANMSIREAFEKYENLSIRKISESLNVNYNMMLKAGKQPMPGEVYNPELLNYTAIEVYLRKKLGDEYDDVDWEEIASTAVITRTKESIKWSEGDLLTIRQDEHTYKVLFVTTSHIVIMAVDGTQPRVFSWNTFDHQTPRKVESQANVDGKEVG